MGPSWCPVLALLLLGCPSSAPVPEPEGCLGPALWAPTEGSSWTFRHPTVAWSRVSGATEYRVVVTDEAGATWKDAVVADTEWRPDLDAAGSFTVTVTASPGGEACASQYRVRTLGDAPTVESPTLACGRDEAESIETAWSVAWSGGMLFSTLNADDWGICAHDAESLVFIDAFASRGETFRSFGLTADADGTLYANGFPFMGACGDPMRRLAVVRDPAGARDLSWVETGMEAGVSVAVAAGLVFETGLAGASCFGVDSFCLELGEPCPDGSASFLAWDLDTAANRFQGEVDGSPGLTADTYRVYRSGIDASFLVHDHDGALLFEVPTDASPRGLLRHDTDDGQFLLVTDFDQHLHVYELTAEAPVVADDLLEVTTRALPDRYWQGAADDQGRLYWAGQLGGRLARWDVE